jgi:hypothetical protein
MCERGKPPWNFPFNILPPPGPAVCFELTISQISFINLAPFIARLPPGVKDFTTALAGAVASPLRAFESVKPPWTPLSRKTSDRRRDRGSKAAWEPWNM